MRTWPILDPRDVKPVPYSKTPEPRDPLGHVWAFIENPGVLTLFAFLICILVFFIGYGLHQLPDIEWPRMRKREWRRRKTRSPCRTEVSPLPSYDQAIQLDNLPPNPKNNQSDSEAGGPSNQGRPGLRRGQGSGIGTPTEPEPSYQRP